MFGLVKNLGCGIADLIKGFSVRPILSACAAFRFAALNRLNEGGRFHVERPSIRTRVGSHGTAIGSCQRIAPFLEIVEATSVPASIDK